MNEFWKDQLAIYKRTAGLRDLTPEQHAQEIEMTRKVRDKYSLGYTIEETIQRIKSNINLKNIHDNDIVIGYLKGERDKVWNLYEKYKDTYRSIFYLETKNRPEKAETWYDVSMECFEDILSIIKLGKYKGINFKAWSCFLLKQRITRYYFGRQKHLIRLEDMARRNISNGMKINKKVY